MDDSKLADHTPQLAIDISYLNDGRSGWAKNPMDQPWGCANFDDSFAGIYISQEVNGELLDIIIRFSHDLR